MRTEETAVGIIAIIMFLLVFICSPIYGIFSEMVTCKNQATAMGFNYDYDWHLVGDNICTYIMPDGKRIISTKYRALED